MNELDEEADKAEAEAKAKKLDALNISYQANKVQAKQRENKYSRYHYNILCASKVEITPGISTTLTAHLLMYTVCHVGAGCPLITTWSSPL